MEKRILFIIPPYFDLKEYSDVRNTATKMPVFTIPYGVLSIASYLKAHSKHQVEVEIIDLNVLAYKSCLNNTQFSLDANALIKKHMQSFHPDYVGISALFNTCYNYLGEITKMIDNCAQNVFQFVGGGLATNLYKDVLSTFRLLDAACYAEGEIPILGLIDAEDRSEFLLKSDAWITYDDLKMNKAPKAQFVINLDDIPFLDFTLIDLNIYSGRALDKGHSNVSDRELSIHTSRGCPFNCVFCSNGTVHGKKVRYMSVNKVVSEVRLMIEKYQMNTLLIEDDHFLSNKVRAKEILKELAKLNIRLEFPNGIAVYALDDELGMLLKGAGATTIPLAVESGSDFVLRNIIQKPLKVDMIKSAVTILRNHQIKVHAFIVIGLPGETDVHRQQTMDMILDVGFDWVYFFNAIPLSGSRLYDICKENNYLVNDDFSFYNTTKCNIITPDYSPDYIERKVYLMNLEANFIKNYNVLNGNLSTALDYFSSIANRYPDHAMVHYTMALIYGCTGEEEKKEIHKTKLAEILAESSVWCEYFEHFNISKNQL